MISGVTCNRLFGKVVLVLIVDSETLMCNALIADVL